MLGAAVLTSCAEDMVNETVTDYLNGSEKTPIEVSLLLDKGNGPVTRAVDNQFDNGDKLIAYLRHVTWEGGSGDRTSVPADQAPKLVTFTATGSEAWTGVDISPIGLWILDESDLLTFPLGLNHTNTKQATGLTASPALYWDDFSSSSSADKDLRTSGHYLQSYYGYCYNGSPAYGQSGTHISTQLFEANGTLGWTVDTDQSNGFKTSDLLWSYEQTPIKYAHVDNEGNKNHGTLILPYTHAMSKVTIEVVCADGFDADVDKNFGSAEVTLNQMNTVTSLTAPTATAAVGNTPADIKMQKGTPEGKKCSFSALIAPTLFKAGNDLATITGVDGNKYTIPLTDAVLTTATSPAYAWSTQLAAAKVGGTAATSVTAHATSGYTATDGGITKPGVNYLITVTIKKQKISVSATIKGWDEVTAKAEGAIHFANDITEKGSIVDELKTQGFDVYLKGTASGALYGSKKTTVLWSSDNWVYDPVMYWPDGANKFYFRALSGATHDNVKTEDINESLTMQNGLDVLWATTPSHSGPETENPTLNYGVGDPIAPRTGDVPLDFVHAMSKITVNLVTDEGTPQAVTTLAGAKISIANLYDEGTINLHDGKITDLKYHTADNVVTIKDFYAANDATESSTKLSEYVVVPQSLTTLADGAEREGNVSFYNQAELMEKTDENGEKNTYVISTLEKKLYTEEEIRCQNADLEGSLQGGAIKIEATYYTEAEAEEYNRTKGAVKDGDPLVYTVDQFSALKNADIPRALFDLFDFVDLTYEEFVAITDKPFAEFSSEDYQTIKGVIEEEKLKHDEISAAAYNSKLEGLVEEGEVKTPAVLYTEEEIKAYNSSLPGAIQPTDVKSYEIKEDGTSIKAKPGDIKTNGANPKIVMLIMLPDGPGGTDGTTYTIDLAQCKDEQDRLISTWEPGNHYKYTIKLNKEKVTFRAMIKGWDEKEGSGNATLDWD